MTCEQFQELSGAYVLDAITPAEREEAEEHLAHCAQCSLLVRELRSAVALLPLSVPQVNPPPSLESRVMNAIQDEAGITALPTQRSRTVQSPRRAQRTRRTQRQRWLPQILVAAAVLMFLLLGSMGAVSLSLSHQVASLQQQLTHVTSQHTTPDIKTYAVQGQASAQDASGQLVYYAAQNITVLVMHGLPQLNGTQVYQGWLVHTKDNKPVSVTSIGLLNTQNGTASLAFQGNVTGYNAAAVSVEHGPTASSSPSKQIIALGSLQQSA